LNLITSGNKVKIFLYSRNIKQENVNQGTNGPFSVNCILLVY